MRILLVVLFLTIYIGTHVYAASRLGKLLRVKNPRILRLLFLIGAVSFPHARMLFRSTANILTAVYHLVAATWIGMLLYLLVFLVGFDILVFVFKRKRRRKSTPVEGGRAASAAHEGPVDHLQDRVGKKAAAVILILTVLISVYSMWNASTFEVNRIDIPLEGIEKEIKILHISDLHIGAFRGKSYLEKIVTAANRLRPDLILITGDMIDSKHALTEDTFSPLKKLEAPVYFTMGNHEAYSGLGKSQEVMTAQNVRVLSNEIIETHGIQLIGLDYMRAERESFDMHSINKATIKEVLPTLNISKNKPTILMHHSPAGIEYVNRHGINLMLAGHTHGGQFFPVTCLIALIFPHNNGLYNYKGTYLHVSPGAGTFGPRMRFLTNNEITLICLKKKK